MGHHFTVALVVSLLVGHGAAAAGWTAELSPAQQALLSEQVIPAYQTGNAPALSEGVRRLTARLPAERIAGIDDYLQQQGLPPLGAMLLESRLTRRRAGGPFDERQPHGTEMRLMLQAVRNQIDTLREEIKQLPAFAVTSPNPDELQAFDTILWSLGQAQQQVVETGQAGRALLDLLPPRALEADETALALDREVKKLARIHRELYERQLELRLVRLEEAVAWLRDSDDVKQRLVAAHIVGFDGAQLMKWFPDPRPESAPRFAAARLNDPQLPGRIREQVEQGRELAGELVATADKLFTGVHWWLRGRYGRGVEFHGLVKSEQVKHSPAAHYQLYMPDELPDADPARTTGDYDYPDRRHYYTWQWETRTLQVIRSREFERLPRGERSARRQPKNPSKGPGRHYRSSGRAGLSSLTGIGLAQGRTSWSIPLGQYPLGTSTYDIYRSLGYDPPREPKSSPKSDYQPSGVERTYTETYIPAQDPYAIYQLVGFVEYALALQALDSLMASCPAEQLAAIDELIADRPELAVATNLSRAVEKQSSTVSELPRQPGDDFERRGLSWMTALARSELAAMLVGFAERDDAFTRLASRHDREAYQEMILDAARTHYWSLTTDRDLAAVLQGDAHANRTLAYLRRLLVAEGFLKATAVLHQDTLSRRQRAELAGWKANLDKLQAVLAQRIADLHQATVDVDVK